MLAFFRIRVMMCICPCLAVCMCVYIYIYIYKYICMYVCMTSMKPCSSMITGIPIYMSMYVLVRAAIMPDPL
jgi:hypothetical protein